MLTDPLDVLKQFPVRKSKDQKQSFCDAVCSYTSALGYPCALEMGNFGCQNVVVGSPETAEYLVTAGMDPSAVLALLEIARTFPENQRHKVCFVLLASARSYRSAHKSATDRQLILHLGYVYSGDQIRMLPSKPLKADRKRLTSLYKACGYFGKKSLLVDERCRFSGHTCFPYTVHICAASRKKIAAQHAPIDTTNINILRAALTTFICCDAAQ